MKLALIGATGMIGQRILDKALGRGVLPEFNSKIHPDS
jgi:putative NADH-flavin reductase